MDYETFINTQLPNEVRLNKVASTLDEKLGKIENIIKKPLPQELKDFYTYCDGLNWHYEAKRERFNGILPADRQDLPSLEIMFDDFKIQPELTITEWSDED